MKSFLFIFLLACVTMLMVLGSVLLVQTDAHIRQVENTFTTIGMVEQKPSSTQTVVYEDGCGNMETATYDVYDELLTLDVLNFEGADYIVPPENRNCYLAKAYINNLFGRTMHFQRQDPGASGIFVAEVIPLEDGTNGRPVSAEIGIVLCGAVKTSRGTGDEDIPERISAGSADRIRAGAFFEYVPASSDRGLGPYL